VPEPSHSPHGCPQCGGEIPSGARICPRCGSLQAHAPALAIAAGSTIDLGDTRIVVDARLGEGGMGIVWRGWLFHAPGTPQGADPPLPIALKVLAPRVRGRPELRALFVHEAEAMRALSHPNVVRLHTLVERGDEVAIAMEYVDGDTLEEVIARHVARGRLAGPSSLPGLPFRRAWHYVQQLLGALAGVHALGLVHRDVKPSNALIRRDGVLKLSDFGIAQLSTDPPAASDPNVLPPGTGAYMSPEQVEGRPLDGRSDLYSAGIVLYEALAGRTPFDVESRGEILVRRDHVETAPPPLRAFVPQAPPVLDALFARALAKDPAARFLHAIEMGEAFRTALGVAESPEWHAQAELAFAARAPAEARAQPAQAARMATLRGLLVERYRTAKMER
jgi:serine/threonine protein kinase